MNVLVLNDEVVAEKLKTHEAEMERLSKPATDADAEKELSKMTEYDISQVLPQGTVAGVFNHAKKQGAVQSYGFCETGAGDVFIPPALARDLEDGMKIAILVSDGPRGKFADKIASLDKFISWHRDEIIEAIKKCLDERNKRDLSWFGASDPTDGWEEKKAKCKALGLELVEIRFERASSNYGGRGSDHYKFKTKPVDEAHANEVLNVLNARHAEKNPKGPYDPGHDRIVLTENGFRNDWCGPWTD